MNHLANIPESVLNHVIKTFVKNCDDHKLISFDDRLISDYGLLKIVQDNSPNGISIIRRGKKISLQFCKPGLNRAPYSINDQSYLMRVSVNLIHKPTGFIIFNFSDLDRIDKFIEIWGRHYIFGYGMTDIVVLDEYPYPDHYDRDQVLIIEKLLDAFFYLNETDHPLN